MSRSARTRLRRSLGLACFVAASLAATIGAGASIVLKDGRPLQGSIVPVTGLAENPQAARNDMATITMVDDNLRRVFVPTFQVLKIDEVESGEVKEKIPVRQNVALARSGSRISRVGQFVKVTPFDDFGRRTVSMMTDKGRLDVVQGITQITPQWTKVEGLATGKRPVVWEMRLATSSIPRETLHKILIGSVDSEILEQRLRIARLFLQSERYLDAQKELEGILADFPNQQQLTSMVQLLRQLYARGIVKEIGVRRKAGQHLLALTMLEQFPAEDVAGETLQQVREMLDEYRDVQKKLAQVFSELTAHVATIKDDERRGQCEVMLKELGQELNINTLDRMAAYLRLGDDPQLGPDQKLALAFSGWLLGSDQADPNLAVALSLAKIRTIVERYLTEPLKLERNQLFTQLRGQEGASPALVAQLIAHMKPPLSSPDPSVTEPGFYRFQIPIGVDKEPDVTYYVQLPPQYDPHVRYPTIVTLNGLASTARRQIDWWAGPLDDKGNRPGQASRLGYIVIAVDWLKEGQSEYEYSAREHAAVLVSLRDACRRFSIHTDRVFLTGHSLGGNAAWDIGLAHPDLWAGVIPIVAESEKYCRFYWENANLVPFYVLGGEFDGDKTVNNARDLDRYLNKRYDVTVVEYRGRGHEDFYEDILNLFDWMGRREPRNFFPKEFSVSTMRTWDNYFWWLEAGKLPPRGIVEPSSWPPGRGVSAIKISGRVLPTNGLSITGVASELTVWLSPEVVDFNDTSRPIRVMLNNRPLNKGGVRPDLKVLLEDVRTRGDRLHPFWAKVEQ